MTQGERVKMIRRSEKINLTMDKFGERLGVTKQTISRIESGINNLTDQMAKAICREFGVNEEWLRDGTGEMFIDLPPEDEFVKAAAEIVKDGDPMIQEMVIQFWKLDASGKAAVKKYLMNLVNALNNKKDGE